MKIRRLIYAVVLLLHVSALAQDVITATSEDLKEFDKLLSKSKLQNQDSSGRPNALNKDDPRAQFNARPQDPNAPPPLPGQGPPPSGGLAGPPVGPAGPGPIGGAPPPPPPPPPPTGRKPPPPHP